MPCIFNRTHIYIHRVYIYLHYYHYYHYLVYYINLFSRAINLDVVRHRQIFVHGTQHAEIFMPNLQIAMINLRSHIAIHLLGIPTCCGWILHHLGWLKHAETRYKSLDDKLGHTWLKPSK